MCSRDPRCYRRSQAARNLGGGWSGSRHSRLHETRTAKRARAWGSLFLANESCLSMLMATSISGEPLLSPESPLSPRVSVRIFFEVSRVQFILPALAKLRSSPPGGEGWLFELKFDGWRVQLHKARLSSAI
jgi:hypothetical protein